MLSLVWGTIIRVLGSLFGRLNIWLSGKVFGRLVTYIITFVRGFIFSSVVKSTEKSVIKRTPLAFQPPIILVTFIIVAGLEVLYLILMLFLSNSVVVSLVSSGSVSAVAAFLLLKGYKSGLKRERLVLLTCLCVVYGAIVVFIVVFDLRVWATVSRITLEVVLCYSVMLLHRSKVVAAQDKLLAVLMKTFRIREGSRVCKVLYWFFDVSVKKEKTAKRHT